MPVQSPRAAWWPAARWSEKSARILDTFSRYAGRPLDVDELVYASESTTGHRNRAIAWMLRNFAILGDDPTPTLEAYFRQCAIRVTCRDLALMGATLANGGVNPVTGVRAIAEKYVDNVLAVMATCGMYDFSGEWLYHTGLAGEERRGRRHPRRAAGAPRHRRLLAARSTRRATACAASPCAASSPPISGCTCSIRRSARRRRSASRRRGRSVASKRRRSPLATEHLRHAGQLPAPVPVAGRAGVRVARAGRARADGPCGGRRLLHPQPADGPAHRSRRHAPARGGARRPRTAWQDAGVHRSERVVAADDRRRPAPRGLLRGRRLRARARREPAARPPLSRRPRGRPASRSASARCSRDSPPTSSRSSNRCSTAGATTAGRRSSRSARPPTSCSSSRMAR